MPFSVSGYTVWALPGFHTLAHRSNRETGVFQLPVGEARAVEGEEVEGHVGYNAIFVGDHERGAEVALGGGAGPGEGLDVLAVALGGDRFGERVDVEGVVVSCVVARHHHGPRAKMPIRVCAPRFNVHVYRGREVAIAGWRDGPHERVEGGGGLGRGYFDGEVA